MAHRALTHKDESGKGLLLGDAGKRGRKAALAVGLAIFALVALQGLVRIDLNPYWDTDPANQQQLISTGMGPATFVWLQVITVALAAGALGICAWQGRRIHWPSLVLAGLGMAGGIWHMTRHAMSLYLVAGWIGAVAGALAVMHLGADRRVRQWLAAGLVALMLPLATDSISYVAIEHPMTVRMFEAEEETILAARGWEEGSTEHQEYERRLRLSDATGSFGLSNVYGSVVAALTLLGLGIGAGQARQRAWPRAVVAAIAVLAGLITLWLTHSRGAMLAFAAGIALLGFGWLGLHFPAARRGLKWAALALVLLAIAVVIARGLVGPPESAAGERSLLFRYYYWQAAGRMVLARPVLGVGPGQFKDAYTMVQNPLNPEQVTSAHNVFMDYVSMMGVFGLSWAALLVGWLFRSGRCAAFRTPDESATEATATGDGSERRGLHVPPRAVAIAAIVGGLLALTKFGFEFPGILLPMLFLLWAAGLLGFLLVMPTVGASRAEGRWTQLGLFAAGALLLIHNQIEMTFFHPGAVALAWLMLGLAASGSAAPASRRSNAAVGWVAGGLLAVATFGFAGRFAIPVTIHSLCMKQAAIARHAGDLEMSLTFLQRASRALPRDPEPYLQRARLQVHSVIVSTVGKKNLKEADAALARSRLATALAAIDQAEAAGLEDAALLRLRASVHWLMRGPAPGAASEAAASRAIKSMAQFLERQPWSMDANLRYADMLWQLGRRDEAREVYRFIRDELNPKLYLDPADQLTDKERRLVEQRLARPEADR